MSSWHAVRVGFRQQLRVNLRRSGQVAVVLAALPQAVVFGWLLHDAGDTSALTRVVFGQVLLAAWTASVLTLGWLLIEESWSGTFELGLVSPSSLVLAMFGKAWALVVGGFAGGLLSAAALLAMARERPEVANLPLTLLSFVVAAVIAVPATAFLVAPVSALSPGTRAFMNGAIPIGIVLGGFLFPVRALPGWAVPLARLLPISWATDALGGAASGWSSSHVLSYLLAAMALAAAWAYGAILAFRAVERRFVTAGSLPL